MFGITWGGYIALPPSWHQHCTAEAQKAETGIEDRSVEGAMIRIREQWIELGEKPTKYFFQLENQRQTPNSNH